MIALKVERIGDRLAVVLTEEAQAALHLKDGDVVHLEAPGGEPPTWMTDPHARGRAFLRRYNKSFAQLSALDRHGLLGAIDLPGLRTG